MQQRDTSTSKLLASSQSILKLVQLIVNRTNDFNVNTNSRQMTFNQTP
jgi:general stress protein 26